MSITADPSWAQTMVRRTFTFSSENKCCVWGGIKYSSASSEIMMSALKISIWWQIQRQTLRRVWKGVFSVFVKADWVLRNLFVVPFFFLHWGGHTGLASTLWKGSSQELSGVLLWEYGLVVLGWVAVRWLAIVTSFVVGISCGSMIVGQIEVMKHPHPLHCGMISAPWVMGHCSLFSSPSSILRPSSCVCLLIFSGSVMAAAVQHKQRGGVAI